MSASDGYKIKVSARDVNGEIKNIQLEVSLARQPLLDELEKTGVALAYGCRAGSCGVCRVRVVQGLEAFEGRGFVEEDTWLRCEDSEDIRLSCQAILKNEKTKVSEIVIEPAPEINPIEDL
jgi:ferredoxin